MSVLAQHRWASLAQDLAVMQVPDTPITDFDMIYSTYDITEDELTKILVIPEFQHMYSNALEQLRSQGTKAGSIYRASTLSQSLAEKLFRDALDEKMKPAEALKLLELLYKVSGSMNNEQATVNTQVNVGVAIPVPAELKNHKLDHIRGAVEAHV